jgi:hypothetical protein
MTTSFWTVVVIAAGIAGVALARATWTPALGLALIVLLLIGALFPPAGLLLGGISLFYLLFIHGQELFKRLSVALGGKP